MGYGFGPWIHREAVLTRVALRRLCKRPVPNPRIEFVVTGLPTTAQDSMDLSSAPVPPDLRAMSPAVSGRQAPLGTSTYRHELVALRKASSVVTVARRSHGKDTRGISRGSDEVDIVLTGSAFLFRQLLHPASRKWRLSSKFVLNED